MNSKNPKNALPRRGVVLIVVLVLVVLLSLAGFSFLASMSTEYEATRIHGDRMQARQALASAESWALHWAAMESSRTTSGDDPPVTTAENPDEALGSPYRHRRLEHLKADTTELFSAVNTEAESGEPATPLLSEPDSAWRFSIIRTDARDRLSEADSQLSAMPPSESAADVSDELYGLTGESGKLHLQTLLKWDATESGRGRSVLMNLPGMTQETADALLDWIDPDDEVREFGAESEYYEGLPVPYRPRNGIPASLTELLYVKGVTRELVVGAPSDDFSSEDTGLALNAGTPADSAAVGWEQFLTVHSSVAERTADGRPRIRLNQPDLSALDRQLNGLISDNLRRYILLARMYNVSFSGPATLELSEAPYSLQTAPTARLNHLGDLIDSYVQLPETAGGGSVASPLVSSDAEFAEAMAAASNLLTTNDEAKSGGLINILSAPAEVLQGIPEWDESRTAEVMNQRDTLNDQEARNIWWLITRNIFETEQIRRFAADVTVAENVHAGEIVVFRLIGGPFLRRKIIIDTADEQPRIVDWEDRTQLGLPLPPRILMQMPRP